MVSVYGMAHKSLVAAREKGDFFCWCFICWWFCYCNSFLCLSLCWLDLCLIYTVFPLVVLSVLSFSWSCGTICLQWCLLFSYLCSVYHIFLTSTFTLRRVLWYCYLIFSYWWMFFLGFLKTKYLGSGRSCLVLDMGK